MINATIGSRKQNHSLLILFIVGIALSAIGYILRGTADTLADHTIEGIGALAGGLSGIVLLIWFCFAIVSLLKKALKNN